MNTLFENWNEGMVPIVNGIVFPDGVVWPVQPADQPRPLPLSLIIMKEAETRLKEQTAWTGALPSVEATESNIGRKAIAGECGGGSDGFVALFESNSEELIWVAFFDFSNPFEALSFDGDWVVARNNLGEIWRIPMAGSGAIDVLSALV